MTIHETSLAWKWILLCCCISCSRSSRKFQVGADLMKKCYNDKVDPFNDTNRCSHIFNKFASSGSPVPDQTSCIASVYEVHPVQYSVGISVMHCKMELFEAMVSQSEQTFIDYQNKRPTPAVAFYARNSSDAGIYLINHHHMAYALESSEKIPQRLKYLKICLVEDMRPMFDATEKGTELFWEFMVNHSFSIPYNAHHIYEDPARFMPTRISELTDDPFRSLSSYVKGAMGYVYCGYDSETKRGANFSLCYGKNMKKWMKEYKPVALSMIWESFLFDRLGDSDDARRLYATQNVREQMKVFRDLLPVAMCLALNGSDPTARAMPSFNDQPWKVNISSITLYDNGCDGPNEAKILEQNHSVADPTVKSDASAAGDMNHQIGMFLIAPACIALMAQFVILYQRKVSEHEEYQRILQNKFKDAGYGAL